MKAKTPHNEEPHIPSPPSSQQIVDTDLVVLEEELARYFLSLDVPPAPITPLEEDLARVNTALAREIPIDEV